MIEGSPGPLTRAQVKGAPIWMSAKKSFIDRYCFSNVLRRSCVDIQRLVYLVQSVVSRAPAWGEAKQWRNSQWMIRAIRTHWTLEPGPVYPLRPCVCMCVCKTRRPGGGNGVRRQDTYSVTPLPRQSERWRLVVKRLRRLSSVRCRRPRAEELSSLHADKRGCCTQSGGPRSLAARPARPRLAPALQAPSSGHLASRHRFHTSVQHVTRPRQNKNNLAVSFT